MSPAGRRQRPCRWGLGQVLAVLLALAAILAGGALGLRQLVTAQYTTRNKPSTDDEIYTGSILFPSSDAIKCHQFLFDNRTGQFTDNGTVDCQKAYYKSKTPPPREWSSMRAQAIGDSFRQH
jgi:hypothetical protein